MRIPAPLAYAIMVLVSVVWACNFFASMFIVGWQRDLTINFVFMTIVGGMLSLKAPNGAGQDGIVKRMVDAMRSPQPPPAPVPVVPEPEPARKETE